MSLEGRVKRLEAWTRPPGGRCEECKFPPDAPGRIVYFDKGLPEDPDERCPGCGRRLWFVIEVVGADTGGGPKL
jgi:hypothetical protein